MKLEDVKQSIDAIEMPQNQKQRVYKQLLQTNHQRKTHHMKYLVYVVMACGLLVIIIPQTRSFAYETIEKLWYMTWGDHTSTEAEYTIFPEELPKENTYYDDLSELTGILQKQLYVPQIDMVPYWYRPFGLETGNEISTISIQSESASAEPIPYEELIDDWTSELTPSQLESIKLSYQKGSAKEDYDHGVSILIRLYGEQSGARGDIQTMPTGYHREVYQSQNLNCEVIIETHSRMDGTIMTYATWIKDDVVYDITGYITYDEVKELIEGMIPK